MRLKDIASSLSADLGSGSPGEKFLLRALNSSSISCDLEEGALTLFLDLPNNRGVRDLSFPSTCELISANLGGFAVGGSEIAVEFELSKDSLRKLNGILPLCDAESGEPMDLKDLAGSILSYHDILDVSSECLTNEVFLKESYHDVIELPHTLSSKSQTLKKKTLEFVDNNCLRLFIWNDSVNLQYNHAPLGGQRRMDSSLEPLFISLKESLDAAFGIEGKYLDPESYASEVSLAVFWPVEDVDPSALEIVRTKILKGRDEIYL